MGKIFIMTNHSGGGGGTDTSVVTATASDVLVGKIIVDAEGETVAGSMPNQGTVAPNALNAGSSYTIPQGYHSGSGVVTTNSLANQTSGTATANNILVSKTAWVNGEQVVGTMVDQGAKTSALNCGGSYTIPAGYHNGSGKITANSLASQTSVESSKTAVTAGTMLTGYQGWVNGSRITGTMTNHGAVSPSALNCGGSYTIPAGYHNGSGKVTANSLANQTDATATAANIISGKTAWVKGSKLTGTLAVTSAINFKAAAQSTSVIRISWTNPSVGPWEGVKIRMSTSGNPGVSGGTLKYTGYGSSKTAGGSSYVDITGLAPGVTYYFTCTSYVSAIGNGSSYNVNAKTPVLWLYNRGTNNAGWKITKGSLGSSYMTMNYNSSADGCIEATYAVNFDLINHIYFRVKFTSTKSLTTVRLYKNIWESSGTQSVMVPSDGVGSANGFANNQEILIDLNVTSFTGTSTTLYWWARQSDGSYARSPAGYIYEIYCTG